jgi:hypothetical protein
MLLGVAVSLESFYKPELDAARNRRLQAVRQSALAVQKYPHWV